MAGLTLDRIRGDGEAFMEALSREYYLAHSGQKAGAELQPLYEQYAPVLGPDALGLVGMRERTALIGGEFEIESAPGKGTTIYVRVPVPA